MIAVTVNGERVEIETEMSVRQLLDTARVPPNYLAVEINARVVPRNEHETHWVHDGDEIEVVTLVGGG